MIFNYLGNIIRFKKWKLLCSLIAVLAALRVLTVLLTFRARVDQLFELHKCPACFGFAGCDLARQVELSFSDFTEILFYFIGAKNVFFGSVDSREVVLKKLAHYSELEEFDERLQERSNYSDFFTKDSRKQSVDFEQLIAREISLPFEEDHLSRLRLCPETGRLSKLLENVYSNGRGERNILVNVWSIIAVNPEPVLLQILSADDGWPVSKYLGACGRVVLEEHSGQPLPNYHDSPWKQRAKIASSLLNAARMFTFKDEHFAFYLTDVSADNIAVNSNYDAVFVDLENVIVVDRNASIANSTDWNELYENEEEHNYPDQLIFSAKEICAHRTSDHNFYAICQMLLASKARDSSLPNGLLHSVPLNVTQTYPILQYLINQCATPVGPYNRIEAGLQLMELLDKILREI